MIEATQAIYFDPYDLELDPSGYHVLVSVRFDIGKIEVEVRSDVHELVFLVQGNRGQDIANEIFKHKVWITTLDHACYLGRELKKAEICLALGVKDYFQE